MTVFDTILILLLKSQHPKSFEISDLCYVQGPDISLKLLDSFGFVHDDLGLLI